MERMTEQAFDANADIKEPVPKPSYGQDRLNKLGRFLLLRTQVTQYSSVNGVESDLLREILDRNIIDRYRDILLWKDYKLIAQAQHDLKVLERFFVEK